MKCMNCGQDVPDTAKVCGYCGHKLIEVEAATAPSEKSNPSPKMKPRRSLWIGLGVLGVILILIVLSIVAHNQQPAATLPMIAETTEPGTVSPAQTEEPVIEMTEPVQVTDPLLQNDLLRQTVGTLNVLLTEQFNSLTEHEWYYADAVNLVNEDGGILEIPGSSSPLGYFCAPEFELPRGVLTRIKVKDAPYIAELFIFKNQWDSPEYKRFGGALFQSDQVETTIWEGTDDAQSHQPMEGSLVLAEDHWYGFFVGSNGSGRFHFMIWDLEDPHQFSRLTVDKGQDWTGGLWIACFQAISGTLYVDDYSLVSFEQPW